LAYTLLNNWKESMQFKSPGASDGVAFTNVDGMDSDTLVNAQRNRTRKDKSRITCFTIGEKGHNSHECPIKSSGRDNEGGAGSVNTQQGTKAETRTGETGSQMPMAAAAKGKFDDNGVSRFAFLQGDEVAKQANVQRCAAHEGASSQEWHKD
jgi:hypothetical protein